MTVQVLFFASYRDAASVRECSVSLSPDATVATLARDLESRFPRLAGLLTHGRAAVNAEFAEASHHLSDGDEVAWMPPVSGGCAPRVLLTREPLDAEAVCRMVAGADCGAVVSFSGTVRNNAREQAVLFLEYEAYVPLAERELTALVTNAEARWPGVRCAIHHRLGRVEIGESSVVAAAAAPHRAEAFDACRWLLDTLKSTVPIWKKEFVEGGAHWVEGPDAVAAPVHDGLDRAVMPEAVLP